jgi:hypothetical protein
MSLSATIKSIQDIMRKDVGVDGDAQRIGQLGWMVFYKIFSDQDAELELNDDNYDSPCPWICAGMSGQIARNWARMHPRERSCCN